MYLFRNIKEVNRITGEWLQEYNHNRPHESLGGKTPVQFANSEGDGGTSGR
jgi:putative transposase